MEQWKREETRRGQTDYIYPLNEYLDITISRPYRSNCYVWQVASYDEVIVSTDCFKDDGYFESFTEALVSLVSYLTDSYLNCGLVTEEELTRIPNVPIGLDPEILDAMFVARKMLMVDNMDSTTCAGILRLIFH